MVDISLPTGLTSPVQTRVVLKVNGKRFNSWKSISINRSIAQIAGSFSFTTSNRYAGENEKWGVSEGDECTVDIGDERVLTGYIDEIADGYSLNSHDVTFAGRDKTGDLVDCPYDVFSLNKVEVQSSGSFPVTPAAGEGEFQNLTPIQIIEKLAKSVSVETVLDDFILGFDAITTKTIPDYKLQTGRMLFEDIAELCQQYGVLPITTGDGKLFITRAATGLARAFDTLEAGVNILSNRKTDSIKDRYSVYYGEGPSQTTAFQRSPIAEGKFIDKYVASKRVRPYIIMVGEQATNDTCQKRAAWEGRIRMGGSRKVETSVYKWTQTNGKIWPLNGLVQMRDRKIGVNDELLIAGIGLNLDSTGGELTTMSLVHPDTFVLKENEPIKSTDGLNAFGRPL